MAPRYRPGALTNSTEILPVWTVSSVETLEIRKMSVEFDQCNRLGQFGQGGGD